MLTFHPSYLDALAEIAKTSDPTSGTGCAVLRDVFANYSRMIERGATDQQLRRWARAYALRIDTLGPEEFDLRCDTGC